jgi:hypothetical protein
MRSFLLYLYYPAQQGYILSATQNYEYYIL